MEAPKKELKAIEVFTEFERRFGRLSVRDQVILAPEKVAMFLRAVDSRDCHDLGILLEDVTTESGLMEEWDDVRSNMSRFTKREKWLKSEEKTTPEPEPARKSGLEDQPLSSKMTVEKIVSPTTMEQLPKGIEDLKIMMVKTIE